MTVEPDPPAKLDITTHPAAVPTFPCIVYSSVAWVLAMAAPVVWANEPHPPIHVSETAHAIHRTAPVIDGHNDLPWALRVAGGGFDKHDIAQPQSGFHTDIDRLRRGGVGAQFWSVYVPTSTMNDGSSLGTTLEQIEIVKEMCRRYPDVFELALSTNDIQRIRGEGRIASMIGVEGGHSIQESLNVLRQLYDQGARYMTLTHSKTLSWADSCSDEAKNNGLSAFGEQVVLEMNRLGMLVDGCRQNMPPLGGCDQPTLVSQRRSVARSFSIASQC